MLRTKARLGALVVEIEAEDVPQLVEEFQYITELDRAREGEEAIPFFRQTNDGYRFYGFRRRDGAEVTWGTLKKPEDPGHRHFAHRAGTEGYRGFQRYDPNRRELVPAGEGEEKELAPRPERREPAAAAPRTNAAKAGADQRKRIHELLAWPCIKEDERATVRQKLDNPRLTQDEAAQTIRALEQRIERRSPAQAEDDLPF